MRSKKEILEKPEKLGFLFLLLHCEKAHKTTAKLFPRGSPHRKQKRHEKQEPAGGSRWDAGPRAGPAEAEPVSAARRVDRGAAARLREKSVHCASARCLGRRCGYGVASGAVKRRPV